MGLGYPCCKLCDGGGEMPRALEVGEVARCSSCGRCYQKQEDGHHALVADPGTVAMEIRGPHWERAEVRL